MHRYRINKLLNILRRHGHKDDLPLDYRTLLLTPRTMKTINIEPRKYYHFGLVPTLKKFTLRYFPTSCIPDEILFNVNIDGLPLAKSSSDQFWPILDCMLISTPNLLLLEFIAEKKNPMIATNF